MKARVQLKRKYIFLIMIAIILIVIILSIPREVQRESISIPLADIEPITLNNVRNIKKLDELEDNQFISFAPTGTIFVTVNDQNEIQVRDYSTGEIVLILQIMDNIRCLAISSDGNELAVGTDLGSESIISLWNISEKLKEAVLVGHSYYINSVAFSPDGNLLASASLDNTVRIWDVETGQSISTLVGHTDWVTQVAFSPDGQQLASASRDRTIRVWNVNTTQEITVLRTNNAQALNLSYSPLDRLLAVTYDDNTIRFWSVADSEITQQLQGDFYSADTTFTPDGLILASFSSPNGPGSENHTLRFWNTITGDQLTEMPFRSGLGIGPVEFAPDGKVLAIRIFGNTEFWGIPITN